MPVKMGLHGGLAMEHRLSPTQLLVAELLPLPMADLAARSDAELAANPALELADRPSCPRCARVVWRGRCRCTAYPGPAPDLAAAPPRSPCTDVLRDVTPTLRAADRRIATYLMADVDRYGVLDEPWDAIAGRLGVGVADIARVVVGMRRAGYPGLCASSLAQRLRLEVAAADGGRVPPEVDELLNRAGRGTTGRGVEAARHWLRGRVELDQFGSDAGAAASPAPVDLVIGRAAHGLYTEVVAGPWSALRVAESYAAHAADTAVRRDVTRAHRLVTALGRREQLVGMVGEILASRHVDWLTGESTARLTLTRRQVAADLGVHESTVSRAVTAKHVALPNRDVVPLATLFGAGAEVHEALRELIRTETGAMSDAALAEALAGRGHVVARRTVAKYRAALGIPGRARRRPAAVTGAAG